MLIAVSVIILLLSFALLPFMFSLKVDVNAFNNRGYIKVAVFGIRIFKADVFLRQRKPLENDLIVKRGKREEEIHINADKNDNKSIMTFFHTLPIMSYIIFERLNFEAKIGFLNDAYYTTLATGALRALFYAITSFLRSRQQIDIHENIMPSYNRNELDFKVFGILKLSLANIINSFISGLINKAKNKRRKEAV